MSVLPLPDIEFSRGEGEARVQRPQTLIWLITARCNLTCSHCYAARFADSDELTEEEGISLLMEAARVGVVHVGLSGGEPFLRPDTLSIIAEAGHLGVW